eukprot:CAMPEP_0170498740 /NCGR_PEP_ID=MMETSP0208-20121228/28807_1 /TAXON_ID=197538 /ORGANISM="Strombidium inclinatum, Strain S3" /LENGTH=50 /DNA_ID=CAMNT_0010776001 /DNA_START=103 /DNA_END=255 /DNA_ORIENTATION=+
MRKNIIMMVVALKNPPIIVKSTLEKHAYAVKPMNIPRVQTAAITTVSASD